MNPVALPPPYQGQADFVPLVALESPYAERIVNFNIEDNIPTLRDGNAAYGYLTAATTLALATYETGTAQKLFLVYDTGSGGLRVSDATSGGSLVSAYAPGGIGGDDEVHHLYFNGNLIFFGETTWRPGSVGNPQYNGTAWSLSGYTFPVSTTPFGGGVYKNRAYMLLRGTTKFVYSNINAISGATTEVDLGGVISSKANLYAIRSVALSEGIQQETIIFFVFASGEVLAYAGSYPDSANWELVGRFQIPRPIDYNAIVEANGDAFVITQSALVSLRTLFTQGVFVAVQKGLSAPIANRWKELFGTTANSFGIRGVFDTVRQRLIITRPSYVIPGGSEVDTDSMALIYSFKNNAWYEHRYVIATDAQVQGNIQGAAFFKDKTYYSVYNASGTCGVLELEGSTNFLDAIVTLDEEAYEYEITSAPIAGGRTYIQQAVGLDAIIKSDMYAETSYQFIADTGVQTTSAQKIPDMGTGLVKAHANVGIEGSYIQYKISGTTADLRTEGYKLYGVNVWTEEGREPR